MNKKILRLIISLLCLTGVGIYLIRPVNPVNPDTEVAVELRNSKISHEERFGGVYFDDVSIEELNALGFSFGDSINVSFSNGFEMKDIPYYNGYYVDEGDPLLVGYPGYPHPRLGYNYGDDVWQLANLTDKMTGTVTLNEKGKYLDNQKARDIQYSDEQGDQSDEQFGNFRNVTVGNLVAGMLYRSASPVDNQHKRAAVVDRLIAPAGVQFIINLSDGVAELPIHIAKEDFNSPYFLSLYKDDKVVALAMSASYKTEDFNDKLVRGLTAASAHDGPYLVHCVEGKDRTGYVCMILEALSGASYQEIVDDYMITYDNYYGITLESDPERYKLIKEKNIDVMLEYVTGSKDYKSIDLQASVEKFLLDKGMKQEDLTALQNKLTGKGN